jgi:hypothetical protein
MKSDRVKVESIELCPQQEFHLASLVGVRKYSSTYLPVVASGGSLGFDLAIEKAINSQRHSARSLSKRATCARAQHFNDATSHAGSQL